MNLPANVLSKIDWLSDKNIRPYIYMRKENLFQKPGAEHKCDWFKQEPLYMNPLNMDQVAFGNEILNLESRAFQKAGMPMPRWVFYDCAIVPGFVCGFARKTSTLSEDYVRTLQSNTELEWTPISLFICIPTIRDGEWVAHNLCSANSLVGEEDQLYALGFLTKAFGLWYANVEVLCGFTQWGSPSIRLHSHYGAFEVLTAYTPIHSHARTLTYRSTVDADEWGTFFKGVKAKNRPTYISAGFDVSPTSDESLIGFQHKIESGKGPYYLDPTEIRDTPLDSPYAVYRLA